DLYALGIVLYEMLTGQHPFDSDNDAALFAKHRFTLPPSFAQRAPGVAVPAALEKVVMQLLEKDPAARFPSGAAVVEALDASLAPAPVVPPRPAARLRPFVPAVVAVVAVAVGGAAAVVFNASSAGPVVSASAQSTMGAPPAPRTPPAPPP